jgi:hypothetical protein
MIAKVLFLFPILFALSGCGDDCGTNVPETAQVKNATAVTLKIELCKIPDEQLQGPAGDGTELRSMVAEYVIQANQMGNFQTDNYTKTFKKKSDNSCDVKEAVTYSSQVFLTTASMAQVRLCRTVTNPNQVTIVTLAAACPAGTLAQAVAVSRCDVDDLIVH